MSSAAADATALASSLPAASLPPPSTSLLAQSTSLRSMAPVISSSSSGLLPPTLSVQRFHGIAKRT